MIAAAFQLLAFAIASAIGTFGTFVPGDTPGSVLFFHFTPDHHLAIAELDASKKNVRSDTPLLAVSEDMKDVRVARGADGIYVVIGSRFDEKAPVMLLRVTNGKVTVPPIEIGHGAAPNVTIAPGSKYVVTSFFEERPPNEPMKGTRVGPPRNVMHVQVRDASTFALEGARMFRGRNDELLDAEPLARPLLTLKNMKMPTRERVAIDLPTRGKRRSIVARLPHLQIIEDRDGAENASLESDTDSSVVHELGEPTEYD